MATATLTSAAVAVVFTILAFAAVLAARPAARQLRVAPATQHMSARAKAGRDWLATRIAIQLLVLAAGAAAVLTLAGIFTEITEAIMDQDSLTTVDRPILDWLATHRSPTMTGVQIGITNLGSALALAIVLTVAAIGAAVRLRSWRPIILTLVAAGGIQLLVYTIKLAIARPRPDPAGRLVNADGFSFPSGHSASALACLGVLAWLICMTTRRHVIWATAWTAAGLLAIAIGLSRAYLGVHYPSDILAGWTLGLIWLTTIASASYLTRSLPRSSTALPATQPQPPATTTT
jgi:undecaprenyl-diphosphatase